MSIVDTDRNAVSMTNTINGYFGAKFLSPSTGIVLNNEMDDFSMPDNASTDEPPPAPANFVHPGKRPLSSMSPTIVLQVIRPSPFHLISLKTTMPRLVSSLPKTRHDLT